MYIHQVASVQSKHVRMHVYTCTYMDIYGYIHEKLYIYKRMYTYTYTYAYAHAYTYTYTHTHTYTYTYTHTYTYTYTRTYTYTYTYTYTSVNTHTHIYHVYTYTQLATAWLNENVENVVAVHCRGGKGRTGTMCSSLMLWTGFIKTKAEALAYFQNRLVCRPLYVCLYVHRSYARTNGLCILVEHRCLLVFAYLWNTGVCWSLEP